MKDTQGGAAFEDKLDVEKETKGSYLASLACLSIAPSSESDDSGT